jgi:hypothetical protein
MSRYYEMQGYSQMASGLVVTTFCMKNVATSPLPKAVICCSNLTLEFRHDGYS